MALPTRRAAQQTAVDQGLGRIDTRRDRTLGATRTQTRQRAAHLVRKDNTRTDMQSQHTGG